MFKLNDISVIIPTYNRSIDLKITLDSFKNKFNNLNEIIIIDQSKDNKTKNLISSYKSKKIKYLYTPIASLTKARNLGIKKTAKSSKILIFFDDDISLGKNYFENIINTFNIYPNAMGISGFFPLPKNFKFSKVENFARKLFLINSLEIDKARVLSIYGNTYPIKLTKTIKSEWIPGVNMAYRKEVFNELRFDEKLTKYALAEDLDFSYRVFKKYPFSLYITPKANLVHRASIVERIPSVKIASMNQINHFYLNFKILNSSIKEKLSFYWVLFGILILRTLLFLKKPKSENFRKIYLYISTVLFCFWNINKLKNGEIEGLYNE